MPEPMLSQWQIQNLATPIAHMLDKIAKFYEDPENERKYQEWYLKKYGKPVPEGE